jgi:hypothetical protein
MTAEVAWYRWRDIADSERDAYLEAAEVNNENIALAARDGVALERVFAENWETADIVLAVIPEGPEAGYAALKCPVIESGTATAVVFEFGSRAEAEALRARLTILRAFGPPNFSSEPVKED